MTYEIPEEGPTNRPRNESEPAIESEEDLKAYKEEVNEALNVLLSQKKDLDSLLRYVFVQPVRTILKGGIQAMKKHENSALDIVMDFCVNVAKIEYPENVEGIRTLQERLKLSEFDKKIESVLAEEIPDEDKK